MPTVLLFVHTYFKLEPRPQGCTSTCFKKRQMISFMFFFFPQPLRNDVEYYGRSSRSPVMLFDIQDNNMNANSFTVN